MVTCRVPSDWVQDISACWYDWQTLIGACLALAGAGLTIWMISEQVFESRRQREDEITRRHRAARVTLPLTLAAVSDVTSEIAKNVCNIREKFTPDEKGQTLEIILEEAAIPSQFEAVSLSPQALSSFEDFVETLDKPSDIAHVHELVASLQVLMSWYNSFDLHAASVATSLERLLLRAARVKLLTDIMFTYAREPNAKDFSLMSNSRAVIWDELHKAAQSLVFGRPSPDLYFDGFKETIELCKNEDKSPWVEGGAL